MQLRIDRAKESLRTALSSSLYPNPVDFTEAWFWDMTSGNLVSENLSQIYTLTGAGTGTYNVAGPGDLVGYSHNSKHWIQTAPSSLLQPEDNSFYWACTFKPGTRTAQVWFDFDSHLGTQEGLYIGDQNTALGLFILLHDGASFSEYVWRDVDGFSTDVYDSNWHILEIIFDRSLSAPILKLDGTSKTLTKTGGVTLDLLGSITPAGGLSFGAQENNGGRSWNFNFVCAYQVWHASSINQSVPLL